MCHLYIMTFSGFSSHLSTIASKLSLFRKLTNRNAPCMNPWFWDNTVDDMYMMDWPGWRIGFWPITPGEYFGTSMIWSPEWNCQLLLEWYRLQILNCKMNKKLILGNQHNSKLLRKRIVQSKNLKANRML